MCKHSSSIHVFSLGTRNLFCWINLMCRELICNKTNSMITFVTMSPISCSVRMELCAWLCRGSINENQVYWSRCLTVHQLMVSRYFIAVSSQPLHSWEKQQLPFPTEIQFLLKSIVEKETDLLEDCLHTWVM